MESNLIYGFPTRGSFILLCLLGVNICVFLPTKYTVFLK